MHEGTDYGTHHHEGHGGPQIFYGYCADTKRMRMMDYPDYVRNVRRAYSELYAHMVHRAEHSARSWWESMHEAMRHHHHPHHWWEHGECGCGHGHHHHHDHHHHGECCGGGHGHDCHCSCCICDADVVEYTHCGERRLIPLLFENDTRRERDVKLELGAFATSSGRELGWQARFSESEFKLGPCGRKTVLLAVAVDCAKLTGETTPQGGEPGRPNEPADADRQRLVSVDECKVGYATVRAEGCLVRPLVVAVAVLPNDCGAHWAGCGCGCCN